MMRGRDQSAERYAGSAGDNPSDRIRACSVCGQSVSPTSVMHPARSSPLGYHEQVFEAKRLILQNALIAAGGRACLAANRLKLNRTSLYLMLERYRIPVSDQHRAKVLRRKLAQQRQHLNL